MPPTFDGNNIVDGDIVIFPVEYDLRGLVISLGGNRGVCDENFSLSLSLSLLWTSFESEVAVIDDDRVINGNGETILLNG